MRLIVFSDTHGSFSAAHEIVERNQNPCTFIFLGDGEKEINKLKIIYPETTILKVSGNCDSSYTPDSDLLQVGKVKVFFTHGHRYNVKYETDTLYEKAKELDAQVVLFGHTHIRHYEYRDGIHILNPGSAALPKDGKDPSYAFVDICPGGIMCGHVDLSYSMR